MSPRHWDTAAGPADEGASAYGPGLPDPETTRVVLAGTSKFAELDDLPAVRGNLLALADFFKDAWRLPGEHCTALSNPVIPRDLSKAVQQAVSQATETLLVYYAGHGLIDPRTGQLHLAVESTERASVHDSAVPYEWIRWEIEKSRAARRIVVLDCCYSARAFGVQSDAAALEVDGTYLLAAAAETAVALSPPGEPLTAFTGELITVLRDGVPNGPRFLDLDTVFARLSTRLATRDRPRPQRLCRNRLGQVPFVRNPGFVPPAASAAPPELAPPQPLLTDVAIADLYTARSLSDTLQAVADGVVGGFGFRHALVHLVRPDGDLVVAAAGGGGEAEAELGGRVGPRTSWDRRLAMGEDRDGLRFLSHRDCAGLSGDGVPEWIEPPDGDAPAAYDAWHPGDRLYAAMFTGGRPGSDQGELTGVISLGRPPGGRLPDRAARTAVRAYAFHAGVAITSARLRANMQLALFRLEREQQVLRASEESLRQIFEYAPSGVVVADLGDDPGRILRVNDALCRLLDRPASFIRRYSVSDFVHTDDLGDMLRMPAEGGRAELRLVRRDGRYVPVSVRTSVVADPDYGPQALLVHVHEV